MTKVFNEEIPFKEEVVEGCVAAYGRFARRVPSASGVKVRSSKLGERSRGHEEPGAACTAVFVLGAAGEALVDGNRRDGMQAGSDSEGRER